jgi:hypothetical protein
MTKKLPKKRLVMLTYIFNAMLRISYWIKTAEIILIPKPGKDPKELTSYRPISLLSTVNKIFEKILPRRINTDLRTSIPHYNKHTESSIPYIKL